jgi:hypothetical protein
MMQEKKRNNYKKFIEMAGLDINKPVTVTGKHYFDSDEGLTIVLQGDDGTFWQNKLKTEAANCLIESLDFKSDIEDDYLIKEKTFVSLLCTIGGMIRLDNPGYDNVKSPLDVVWCFIEDMRDSNLLERPEFQKIINRWEEELKAELEESARFSEWFKNQTQK